jgi:hypothetical protein
MKIEINQNEIDHIVSDLNAFWDELAWRLEYQPNPIAISDWLERNRHLSPFIADDDEAHCELLYRAR